MNVASLDLCKRLYELSGWDDVNATWQDFGTDQFPLFQVVTNERMSVGGGMEFPAYDLGYLLRKLPNWTNIEKWHEKAEGGLYLARGEDDLPHQYKADAPEDAAAKLCIGLFTREHWRKAS